MLPKVKRKEGRLQPLASKDGRTTTNDDIFLITVLYTNYIDILINEIWIQPIIVHFTYIAESIQGIKNILEFLYKTYPPCKNIDVQSL